jgi:hypothetical protein
MLQKLAFGLFLLISCSVTQEAQAAVRISNDRGGLIGAYIDRYQRLRNSGKQVVIDGLCASACTIILAAIPNERICVTQKAVLGFHAAWNPGYNRYGKIVRQLPGPEATQMLYNMYPSPVQQWINWRGGLTPHMIFMDAGQLMTMYRPCSTRR